LCAAGVPVSVVLITTTKGSGLAGQSPGPV